MKVRVGRNAAGRHNGPGGGARKTMRSLPLSVRLYGSHDRRGAGTAAIRGPAVVRRIPKGRRYTPGGGGRGGERVIGRAFGVELLARLGLRRGLLPAGGAVELAAGVDHGALELGLLVLV